MTFLDEIQRIQDAAAVKENQCKLDLVERMKDKILQCVRQNPTSQRCSISENDYIRCLPIRDLLQREGIQMFWEEEPNALPNFWSLYRDYPRRVYHYLIWG